MTIKTNKVVAINYQAQVDRLGQLNALVAPLADEIESIKSTLRESGYECIEGSTFRVTIGETADKKYIDYKAVAVEGLRSDKLARLAAKFTTYKSALGAVRCVAKVRGV